MSRTVRIVFCALVLIGTIGAGTKIIGSADGDTPGFHVDVTQLRRISGNMVSLKFVFVNGSNAEIGMGGVMDGDNAMRDNDTIAGVDLNDGTTKYVVVRDAQGKCVCSSKMGYLNSKARLNLWAKFPAPPASVTKLSVEIPHFPPIDDVPLTPISK
jgi:hypothetical protein